MERKLVLRIYICLIGLIIINPLFKSFISNTTFLNTCELFCLIIAIYSEWKLFSKKMLILPKGITGLLFFLLCAIMIGIIVRGDWQGLGLKDFMLKVLVKSKGWLLPMLLIPLPNRRYFKDIIRIFFKSSLIIFPLWFLCRSELVQAGTYKGEHVGVFLGFFSAFLLGLPKFFTKKQKYITVLIWAIYFLLMLLNARRNASLTLAIYAFIAYVFSILNNIKKHPLKYSIICNFSVIAILFIYLNSANLASGIFRNLANRATEDTRSGVEELFFMDFAKSPVEDWIFGRGMDGGYYQIVKNEETGEINDSRQGIETGYLTMMLKGGLLYDFVVVLLMIVVLCGTFRKENDKTIKYIAVILITYFLDMYTTNPVVDYGVRSILFWFIISVLIQNKNYKNGYTNYICT